MFSRAILIFLAGASITSVVRCQTIPDVTTFPAACATSCGSSIELTILCESEYTNSTDIAACFCVGLPSSSDLTACSSCLNSNGQGDIGTTLTTAASACPAALQTCAFECDFTTCTSTDIACQCSETYLQNILQCATCNTANNNTGTTMLTNYNELVTSCEAQNYTSVPSGTTALPSPTGQSTYVAPSLTASGSGSAAASSTSTGATVAASTTASVTGLSSAASGTARASSSSAAAATTTAAASSGNRNAVMGLAGFIFGAMGLLVIV